MATVTQAERNALVEPYVESPVADEARRRTEALTRIVVRPIGSPVALGLYGLGAATLVVAGQQLGWVAEAERKQVALIVMTFPFVAQLVASLWSTVARDAVAATAMGVLALTWLALGVVQFSTPPGSVSDALGLLLLFSAVAMALTAVSAALSKLAIGLVFMTAAVRFALGGIHQLTGNETWEDAAGVVGLVLFAFAVYCAFASELEDAKSRSVLPLGRRDKGSLALDGSLEEQMKHAPNDAGVRQRL